MKVIQRGYGIRMNSEQRQRARSQAADTTRTRGTALRPGMPRDVFIQPAPRGILINWRGPAGFDDDIAGWRIYKDTEANLFAELHDPNTTQHFIDSTAGSTPPVTNIFVSSINKLGVESPLVPATGSAITEAGAPTLPSTPPTYERGGRPACPLSGAPVKLWGKPEWWTKTVVPHTEFFKVTTETGREGTFSREHRSYCRRGLLALYDWHIGDFALTEDGEECVGLIEALTLPNATVDRYEATSGHVYSAWGFIGHNVKRI
jgi:hypothetical protein